MAFKLVKEIADTNAEPLQIRWIKRCPPSFKSRFIITLSNFVTEIHLFFNTLVCIRSDQANSDLETGLFSGAPDLTCSFTWEHQNEVLGNILCFNLEY